MVKSTKVKMKPHTHGKDLPRYKVIVAFEKEFKMEYAKMMANTLTELVEHIAKFGQ